jgi:hypothetical protein
MSIFSPFAPGGFRHVPASAMLKGEPFADPTIVQTSAALYPAVWAAASLAKHSSGSVTS